MSSEPIVLNPGARKPSLCQYFTPVWAAERLVEKFFRNLAPCDLVLEPSCGAGAFLQAIPPEIPAIGIEIDPEMAEVARYMTGRKVITGDFCNVPLPADATHFIGNPPFRVSLITKFLERLSALEEIRRGGLIMPGYAIQTENTVNGWRENWELRLESLPRTLFSTKAQHPLVFVLFNKGKTGLVQGFCLYDEAVQFRNLSDDAKDILANGRPHRSIWRALVEKVLTGLGGEANLQDIYQAVEPERPTGNPWWREKVRQELQRSCVPVSRGRWRLKEEAVA